MADPRSGSANTTDDTRDTVLTETNESEIASGPANTTNISSNIMNNDPADILIWLEIQRGEVITATGPFLNASESYTSLLTTPSSL
jgi:hypothetical protein